MPKTLTIPENNCLACGYTWLARIAKRPVKCPACQSRNWDIKNKSKESKENS